MVKRYVVGITGASGSRIALTLLGHLHGEKHLVVSEDGASVMQYECGVSPVDLQDESTTIHDNRDMMASIASGSYLWDACIIAPCSMTTLARIASGMADTLIARAASIALKERRKLVLVPREMPLSRQHLKNMLEVTDTGAVVIPAMMTFYTRPESVQDMVDAVVARVLDVLGIPHTLSSRWGQG